MAVVAQQTKRNPSAYRLLSAWFGTLAEREPVDPSVKGEDFSRSLEFWSANALIHDPADGPITRTTWRSVLRQYRRDLDSI